MPNENLTPRAMAGHIPVYCAFDEIVPAVQLVPNPRNPNKHPEAQIKKLAEIIAVQGWRAPVTVSRRSGFIVRGHGRLETDRYNQAGQIPVEYQDYLTEADEWADLIADNRLAELSEIDDGPLGELLAEIDAAGFPLDLTGYNMDECEALFSQMDTATAVEDDFNLDEAVEQAATPLTRSGDLYLIDGRHRILCGDSTRQENVERLMDGKQARLCVTDPPYNVDYVGKTEDALQIQNDNMNAADYEEFLAAAFGNMAAASAPGAAAYVFHPDTFGLLIRQAYATAGFVMKQCLIWNKNVFVLGRQDYQWKHEPILYGWKPGAAHYFTDERTHSTVIEANKPTRSDLHPTMKPIPLLEPLIKNSSKPGWLVLDLFGGSGSTLLACEQLGRHCNMMEYDPRFCDVIVRRYLSMKASQDQSASVVLIRDGEQLPCPFIKGGAN